MTFRITFAILGFAIAAPVLAQGQRVSSANAEEDAGEWQTLSPQQTPLDTNRVGRIGASSVGQVGERQTREKATAVFGSTARIPSRIQNRVQSRLRNRIDRNFDPQANAADPFAIAEDQARTTGQSSR